MLVEMPLYLGHKTYFPMMATLYISMYVNVHVLYPCTFNTLNII